MTSDLIFQCLANNYNSFQNLDEMQKIEVQLFTIFMGLANRQFEWKGLPKTIKPYQLEKVLNMFGQGVVFKYNDQYLITPCTNSANLNIYGEPCVVQPVAINGMNFDRVYVNDALENGVLTEKNGVLIRNNLYCVPTYFILKPFIANLCFIWESKGINAGLSRIKAIVHANKNVASTIQKEIKRIVGSRSAIPVISEKQNILSAIEKVDFNVEYTPDKYWEDFDRTMQTMLQFLGITTNTSQGKKERLIVSEVESNDELTTISEDTRLDFRKQGCDEVNELFGESWSVENKVQDTKPTQTFDKQPNQEKTELGE